MKCKLECPTCEGYCELATAASLADFLRRVDTIESPIGEIRQYSNNEVLMVSGVQISKVPEPVYILTKNRIDIDRSEIFVAPFNKPIVKMLKDYLDIENAEDKDNVLQLLKSLNTGKRLLMPFRIGEKCINKKPNSESWAGGIVSYIESVKWAYRNADGRLHCELIMDAVDWVRSRIMKHDIESYGKNFRLSDVEALSVASRDRYKYIAMDRLGYIKPITVFTGKGDGVALDGSYLYGINKGEIKIIGMWGRNHDLKVDSNMEEFIKKVIPEKDIDFIAKHRRLIAPFTLVGANVITKKGGQDEKESKEEVECA